MLIFLFLFSGRIAQVVERPPLDREVRGSNPSHDTMALLLLLLIVKFGFD
jgi:hypothetical protein